MEALPQPLDPSHLDDCCVRKEAPKSAKSVSEGRASSWSMPISSSSIAGMSITEGIMAVGYLEN